MTAPGRPTIVMKVVTTILEDVVRLIIGLAAMAAGGWLVAYEAKHPPASTVLIVAGIVAFGAGLLIIPFVLRQVQTILVVIAPYAANAPVVGPMFRRKTDVPPDPPAAGEPRP